MGLFRISLIVGENVQSEFRSQCDCSVIPLAAGGLEFIWEPIGLFTISLTAEETVGIVQNSLMCEWIPLGVGGRVDWADSFRSEWDSSEFLSDRVGSKQFRSYDNDITRILV